MNEQNNLTDKLFLVLALSNILMVAPSLWALWLPLSIAWTPHQGSVSEIVTNVILYSLIWFLVLGFTTWAFFKRQKIVLFLYFLYLSYRMPMYIYALMQFFENDNTGWSFLASRVYTWFYIVLWLLTLITFITMLFETDYRSLRQKYQTVLKKFIW